LGSTSNHPVQELEDGGQAVNVITSGTYTSGITATGSATQTCNLAFSNGFGSGGTATVALTGTNTIAGGTALVITAGGYYGNAPTQATVTNGTATCSGTATVTVDGGANDDPVRQYGLITNVIIPSGVTMGVQWDCPIGGGPGGSDECQASSTYSGGYGWTDRETYFAGSTYGSTGNTAFEAVVVGKIAQSLSDTTLTSTALNPDSNWAGVHACGAVSCFNYLGSRGGATYSAVTSFTVGNNGTPQQYFLGGLATGTYAITVGGSAVPGSPFTVVAGDNSVTFNLASGTTGGAVVVNGSGPAVAAGSLVGGGVKNSGVIIH
jgi:hypothetical protein